MDTSQLVAALLDTVMAPVQGYDQATITTSGTPVPVTERTEEDLEVGAKYEVISPGGAASIFGNVGGTSVLSIGDEFIVGSYSADLIQLTVTDGQDADLAAFFVTGQLIVAKGSAIAVGDTFMVLGTGDLADDALATAKAIGAIVPGDVFTVTGISGSEAVAYSHNAYCMPEYVGDNAILVCGLGDEVDATLAALFAGPLKTLFGRDVTTGDMFSVISTADTADDALATAKGSAVAALDYFYVSGTTVIYGGTIGTKPYILTPQAWGGAIIRRRIDCVAVRVTNNHSTEIIVVGTHKQISGSTSPMKGTQLGARTQESCIFPVDDEDQETGADGIFIHTNIYGAKCDIEYLGR